MNRSALTLPTWPFSPWKTIVAPVSCNFTNNQMTVSGSGSGWSASDSTISLNSSHGNSSPSYYILNLLLPVGYSWPTYSENRPDIKFYGADKVASCGIYTDYGRLPLCNTLSGTTGTSYESFYQVHHAGSVVSGTLTISFLPPAQGEGHD